jgi:hypothetical protein
MNRMDRRSFLKLAGAGSAAAVVGSVPAAGALTAGRARLVQFRAAAGLPQPPLPIYATHIVEGSVDLASGRGVATSRVVAGHPDGSGDIGLPGLSRVIRITAIHGGAGGLRLYGQIDDRSQLRAGESAQVEMLLNRAKGVLSAPFVGRQIELRLQ